MNSEAIREMFSQVTKEYLEGYQSYFKENLLVQSCPYLGTKKEEWSKGWEDAFGGFNN
jgi:hypothetical protein